MNNPRLLIAAAWLFLFGAAGCMPPSWGAAALLHPARRLAKQQPAGVVDHVELDGEGVRLKAWRFHGATPKQGTVIYLHGVGDNRGWGLGIAGHFVPRGFDVIAYDSRAHGESQGDACTYGYYESRDVSRVVNEVQVTPVVLLGSSMGAAVAILAAAQDRRVHAVIAVAPFSDLRTIANERAPFFASQGNIDKALRIAEETARFRVDEVSPVAAAARITVPTLIIHGDRDDETPPSHSRRIFAALGAPKRLILVPNRGHHDALTPEVWREIDAWLPTISGVLGRRARAAGRSTGQDAVAGRSCAPARGRTGDP